MLNNNNILNNQNNGMVFEEKRAFKRVPVNIDARFFCTNMFYSGKISNLSETGMFINTRKCFPIGTTMVVIIHDKREVTRVYVKIKRMERSHEDCDGVAVKLVSPSKAYADFVKDLKTT